MICIFAIFIAFSMVAVRVCGQSMALMSRFGLLDAIKNDNGGIGSIATTRSNTKRHWLPNILHKYTSYNLLNSRKHHSNLPIDRGDRIEIEKLISFTCVYI
jgi:hypothetical protein